MVSPARRREAVAHVRHRLPISERRACIGLAVARSSQRYRARRPEKDRELIGQLHRLGGRHPRYGYRRITALLRREGWRVNRKRVQRLWRQEGLKVPARTRKRRRLGSVEQAASALQHALAGIRAQPGGPMSSEGIESEIAAARTARRARETRR